MDARHVAHWGTLSMMALFAVTGVEVRTTAPVTDVTATAAANTVEIQMIGDATSFAGAPSGRYVYNCAPHLALGMKAVIDVR